MYGMNENQNVCMEGKRTTSRVTNEPGGKSSVCLGWDSPKSKEPKKEKENVMQIVGSSAVASSTTTTKPMSDIDKKQASWGVVDKGVSSNIYANGSSQNVDNVITDRPSSRRQSNRESSVAQFHSRCVGIAS